MTELFVGDDCLQISCAAGSDIAGKADALLRSGMWEEVVPGLDSLCVTYDPEKLDIDGAKALFLHQWDSASGDSVRTGETVVLKARFGDQDMPDGALIAAHIGIDAEQLPEWLAAREFVVAMMGFLPGFPYLRDLADDVAPLSRLAEPRQSVPAGSIGFLGDQACIYPFDSPGGWPIIGRVVEPIFNSARAEPALLRPGQRLRFVAER